MTWSRSASGTRSASLAACVSQLWRPLCCRGNASGQRGGHCCASLLPPETVTTAAAVASPHHLGPAFHPPQIESVISFLAVTWLGATAAPLNASYAAAEFAGDTAPIRPRRLPEQSWTFP